MKTAMMLAMLVTAGASAAERSDFSGVWVMTEYRSRLLTVAGKEPPLLPEPAARYRQTLAAAAQGDVSFDPTGRQCASPGTPRTLFLRYPFEIIQTAQQVTFLFEWNHLFRTAPMGAAWDYGYATAAGTSRAVLEGDSLVIHTDALADTTFLDASGLPHSEKLQVTERYQLAENGKRMTVHFRFEDPDTFAEPWEASAIFKRLQNHRLREDVCLDRQARGEPTVRR